MPRLWSTAWSLGLTSSSQATSTRKLYLQHLDSFYRYCDERFGADAFDEGMSTRDAEGVMLMVESFYLTTTSDPAYNTTDVQRWGVVRAFVQSLAKRLAPSNPEWAAAASMLAAMGRMRAPRLGGFRFIRALPKTTLLDLLEVAHPSSPRNPFKGYQTRVRNWLIVNLMLLAGLRRGEALLLACDSLKEDVDPESGEVVRWLDITTVFENDPNPAKMFGIDHEVGSIAPGKLADLVFWRPDSFGIKPELVMKSGFPVWAPLGEANASLMTCEPLRYRPMWGCFGRAPQALGVRFVAPPSIAADIGRRLDLKSALVAVTDTRGLTKRNMLYNDLLADIRVDPETFRVYIDGQTLISAPATRVTLGASYMLK
jgi:Amidohydrolase family